MARIPVSQLHDALGRAQKHLGLPEDSYYIQPTGTRFIILQTNITNASSGAFDSRSRAANEMAAYLEGVLSAARHIAWEEFPAPEVKR